MPRPLSEILDELDVLTPGRADESLPDTLLERSFQLVRELYRLARPHLAILKLHPDGKRIVRDAEALIHALDDERRRRIVEHVRVPREGAA